MPRSKRSTANYNSIKKKLKGAKCVKAYIKNNTVIYEFKTADSSKPIIINEDTHKYAKEYIINALKTKKFQSFISKSKYKDEITQDTSSTTRSRAKSNTNKGRDGRVNENSSEYEYIEVSDESSDNQEKHEEEPEIDIINESGNESGNELEIEPEKEPEKESEKESEKDRLIITSGSEAGSNDDGIECLQSNSLSIDFGVMDEHVAEDVFGLRINKFTIFLGVQPSEEGFQVTFGNIKGERRMFNMSELDFEQLTYVNVIFSSFLYRKGLF